MVQTVYNFGDAKPQGWLVAQQERHQREAVLLLDRTMITHQTSLKHLCMDQVYPVSVTPLPLQPAAALPREFVPISNLFTLLYQDNEVGHYKPCSHTLE